MIFIIIIIIMNNDLVDSNETTRGVQAVHC